MTAGPYGVDLESLDGSVSLLGFTSVVGQTVANVRRLFYVYAGEVRTGVGPIELTLGDGTVMFFDVAGDGEALSVGSHAWLDPFREPLSEANREFVEQSGKWTAFDASSGSPLNELTGHPIIGIDEITSRFGDKTSGVVIGFATAILRIEVEADEVFVSVESDQG